MHGDKEGCRTEEEAYKKMLQSNVANEIIERGSTRHGRGKCRRWVDESKMKVADEFGRKLNAKLH